MAKSRKERNTKNIKPFDEMDTKLAQGFVKKVGQKIGVRDYVNAQDIIDRTESNPLKRKLRQIRLDKNNPLDPGLGGV